MSEDEIRSKWDVTDYNGQGDWSVDAVIARYHRFAIGMKVTPRDLTPQEHVNAERRWIYPVMHEVINGIRASDPACAQIGIEFIECDGKFAFGKTLKSKTARALRQRAILSEPQKTRIRTRVFGMLEAGIIPHEYGEYAKLVKKIGFRSADLPYIKTKNRFVQRFVDYFQQAIIKK